MTKPAVGSRPALSEWWLVAAMLILAASYFYQDPEWNGNSRLDLTRALVEEHSLRIDSYHARGDWATGDKALFQGHYYSDKAIGSSLLAVPFLVAVRAVGALVDVDPGSATVKHVLTLGVMGTSFAAAGIVMYGIALALAIKRWKALVATLAVSLGTLLWPYSAVFYGHVPAATFLIVAFYLVFSVRVAERPAAAWRWCGAGLMLALAFITDYTTAPIAAGIAVYAAYVLRDQTVTARVRVIAASVVGTALPLVIMALYNLGVYHTPLAFGYAYEAEDRFQAIMGLGVAGIRLPTVAATYHITFDPQFGLFWLSPVLLLAVPGYVAALRSGQHRAEALLSLYAFCCMLAINAGSFMWWGGSAFGPRLLIPALPFFIIPLALVPDSLLGLMGILAALSCAQMLIPLLGQIQFTKLDYKLNRSIFYVADAPFRGFSLLYEYGLPRIAQQYEAGQPLMDLGAAIGIPYWLSLPALILGELGLIVLFWRRSDGPSVVPES